MITLVGAGSATAFGLFAICVFLVMLTWGN